MAKTFLEFENKLINVYEIKSTEKTTSWNRKTNQYTFNIEINRESLEDSGVPVYKFEFATEQYRDDQWELMKLQLSDLESIDII